MTSSSFDLKRMFSKGYCSPLSSSAVLTEKLSEMYEPIQRLLTHDDNIYGAPFHCYVGYYTYCPDAWAEAGLTAEDVPTSFVEYLDFLEAWAEHIRDNPEDEISVSNAFDSEQYGEHSYISYLVDRLITNHIMQCNYAGEPLRFDTPLFRELLERCQSIGTDLYLYEPEQKADLALFEDLYGMRELKHLVPLRLTSDQPVLIKATLYTAFLNVRSQHQALATEYLEDCVTCTAPEFGAYLYQMTKVIAIRRKENDMKKARIFAFVMLVVLAVSFSACALAGTQAYNFNLRAVSSGLTGFRGSKNDDEARFYVTQTSATPESAYPNATWEKTLYRATWLDSGAVASNTLTLTSNTSSSASYTDTVDTGDSFKLNLRLRTPTAYENVYFTIKGRWTP